MFRFKKVWFLVVVSLVLSVFSLDALAAGKEEKVRGTLMSLDSVTKSLTLQTMKGKKVLRLKVADNVKWHICLAKECVETEGVDGYKRVNEYANFEAYGLPLKSYEVEVERQGDTATKVEVEIAPGKHKKR